MRAASALVLSLVACTTLAADGWLDDLRGEWSGRGRFMGNEADYSVVVEPALGGQFTRMRVRYTWRDAGGGEATFLGEALYPADGQGMVHGSWFDSEGHRFATSAYRDARGALVVHWGDGSLSGRTEYRPLATGGLEVSDNVKQDAGWQTFSQASLKRTSGPG